MNRRTTGCARTHKKERNQLVKRLQDFSRRKQVRITILSGDVHLACVGRFFSDAKLNIPQVSPLAFRGGLHSTLTAANTP